MSNKIFKESLIIFLLIFVIVFAMRILFYDLITEDVDDIIEPQYATSELVIDVLEDIEENGGKQSKPNSSESLLKSYSITEEDLTGFATDKYYESGKKDPFAECIDEGNRKITSGVQNGSEKKSR